MRHLDSQILLRLALLSAASLLVVIVVSAQDEPPPPPPLIYSAPEESSLQKFISRDEGFEAVFSGVPTSRKTAVPNGTITAFSVYKNGSHSMVQVWHLTDPQLDRSKLILRLWENFSKIPKTSIESDNDIELSGVSGHEFDVLSGYQCQRARVFVVGVTVYIVSVDVTNWHILTAYYKDRVADFQKESQRFLDSFKLSK